MFGRRLALALAAALMVATACSNTTDSAMSATGGEAADAALVAETGAEGDAVAFCTAWEDVSMLLVEIDEQGPTDALLDDLAAAMDDAEADVPAEIRGDWEAIGAFLGPFSDVLVTVEYDVELINDEILELAFGSVAATETLEAAADAGQAAIADWSHEGCGDFCARWPDTRDALEQTGQDLGWVHDQGPDGEDRYRQMIERIAVADALVPAELAADWNQLVVVHRDSAAFWEQFDFERQRVQSAEGRDAAVLAAEAPWFVEVAFEMWGDPQRGREALMNEMAANPEQFVDFWRGWLPEWIMMQAAEIGEWADANCEVTDARPGRLSVIWPAVEGALGSQIVLRLMPLGSGVDDIADTGSAIAGWCDSVSRDPWGFDIDHEGNRHEWATEPFFAPRGESSWCDFDWEGGPAQIPAGKYTLLALLAEGIGERLTIDTARACAALDVTIDDDTTVALPELVACDADLTALEIDPGPWRFPAPVDPSIPGVGTLQVVVPALETPESAQAHGGQLQIVVLPAGTTLNQVGREQVWPSGVAFVWLVPGGGDQARELARYGPVAVPIMPLPATGWSGGLDPHWLAEGPPLDEFALARLAPGDYDVYVHVEIHTENQDQQIQWCTSFEAEVNGDTTVEMPELGECP